MSVSKRRKDAASTGEVELKFYTVDQAAEALQLNYYTVIRLISDGEIAAVKWGKEWRIPVAEIDAFIADLMKQSAAVRAEKADAAA
ncbi:hypothetical protein BBK82_03720 [Lentzea guizhouensis]|uniref:Helix-turn-helix domain-containing protein n=1 Tax=Lentzea guizhouensis TaxID=1586287 RepID=A0A1B2HC78_9PSEU|nr:helix-turn-helix domain-containing protein [Lentzea guizhouensis]ANZ35325.1 hypothetical protein BBK82_03720 [Lentzea guizhouensis]